MTLDQYQQEMQALSAELQAIAKQTATLALAGAAHPGNPEFTGLLQRQWDLTQRFAKINTEMLLGFGRP